MIQLKTEMIETELGITSDFVDAAELYFKIGDRRPFGLWFASFRRGLPELIEGKNIVRQYGNKRRTLIDPDIARQILMMSPGKDGDEYRSHLIESANMFPHDVPCPPGFEWLLLK